MDILMACSELMPIVKVGGLADAVGALSKTLSRLDHRVTIALPKYQALDDSGLMLARRLTRIVFEVGGETVKATLYDTRLGSDIELLVIDVPGMFDRPWIYGPDGGEDPDNAARFGLYCRALQVLIAKRAAAGQGFDVVHAHDWPTALLPWLLREEEIRTVLTIHNGAHVGQYPKAAMDTIGLDAADFNPAGLEYFGDISLLKAGVLAADVVTTVSASYAQELRGDEESGLGGVLRSRGDSFLGIANGIDYARWSPSTDQHLAARYDAEAIGNKSSCKARVLHDLEIPLEPARPLLLSLGRICHQKGSDVLAEALPEILRTDAHVIIAGEGDPELTAALQQAADASRGSARLLGHVSEAMAHQLIAAADAVLMPSRFEPCGLVQQYAQRYGAVPIATAVGGLRDTIVDVDARAETGTGFLFDDATSANLVGAVQRAVAMMATPHWATLRRRIMRLDRSWERPARRYAKLYA